ncbi:MAG: cupin [Candidatus Curtissbacteria bacterium]
MPNTSKKFDTASYVRKIEKPWGWEIHWTPDNMPYMGKILHLNAGARCSLQKHDQKLESWFIMSGRAKVIWDSEEGGELIETELVEGQGYSCEVGQKHRLAGITDCDIIEVSTPEIGTTFRLEDDYKRVDETPEERKKRNQTAV